MPVEPLLVELWVDDHQEYEPGVVHARLRHARVPLDPRTGDYLVVGDDEIEPARVLSRSEAGQLRLRMLPGPARSRPELQSRRQPVS